MLSPIKYIESNCWYSLSWLGAASSTQLRHVICKIMTHLQKGAGGVSRPYDNSNILPLAGSFHVVTADRNLGVYLSVFKFPPGASSYKYVYINFKNSYRWGKSSAVCKCYAMNSHFCAQLEGLKITLREMRRTPV